MHRTFFFFKKRSFIRRRFLVNELTQLSACLIFALFFPLRLMMLFPKSGLFFLPISTEEEKDYYKSCPPTLTRCEIEAYFVYAIVYCLCCDSRNRACCLTKFTVQCKDVSRMLSLLETTQSRRWCVKFGPGCGICALFSTQC